MELCSGQMQSLLPYTLGGLIPKQLKVVHGPGAALPLTPVAFLDLAMELASATLPISAKMSKPTIFCATHELLRMRGSKQDLLDVKAEGGDVRVVYSPLDCLAIASANPECTVIFLTVGFEQAAHADAMAIWQARRMGLKNFFLLGCRINSVALIKRLLESDSKPDAILVRPDLCFVTGTKELEAVARENRIPIVVSGYESEDLLETMLIAVKQLEAGDFGLKMQYNGDLKKNGDVEAQSLIREVFELKDGEWRCLGPILRSSYELTAQFKRFDAGTLFDAERLEFAETPSCISADVLLGRSTPLECNNFGGACTPLNPLGSTMSCDEGSCALYYKHSRSTTFNTD
jgi:hydrogenase expression/formation protein HypD